eukprot:ANDGO_06266.mRNA.1 Symplectin
MGSTTMKCLIVLCLLASYAVHAVSSLKVGVVEYTPETDPSVSDVESARAVLRTNLENYNQYLSRAEDSAAQLLVFPEYGLYGSSANLNRTQLMYFAEWLVAPSGINPCQDPFFNTRAGISEIQAIPNTQDARFYALPALSCMALKYKVNLGVDFATYVMDPKTGTKMLYNTFLLFDSFGTIVASYFKSHLYKSESLLFDVPPVVTPTVFSPDEHTRFGMLVCFDIMFPYPLQSLMERNITGMLVTSWWVNTGPVITSLPFWQAYARYFDIDVVVSTVGASWFNSGSGVFRAGGQMLDYTYNSGIEPRDEMVIVDLPLNPRPAFPPRESSASSFQSTNTTRGTRVSLTRKAQLKKPQKQQQPPSPRQQELCGAMIMDIQKIVTPTASLSARAGDVQCSLDISYERIDAAKPHALVAMDGLFNGVICVKSCSLVQCLDAGNCSPVSGAMHSQAIVRKAKLCIDTTAESFAASRFFPLFAGNSTIPYPPEALDVLVSESRTSECLQVGHSSWKPAPIVALSLFGRVWGI